MLGLLGLSALACRQAAPPAEQLYAEILRSPQGPTHGMAMVALQPALLREDGRLVDDAGHLLPSDSLPSRVVTSLQASHLVSEVCRTQRRIPAELAWCWVDSAQNGIRFSRPVPGDSGTWQVLVEVTSTHQLGDSSHAGLGSYAFRYACRLEPDAGGWRLRRCHRGSKVLPEGPA